MVELSIKEKFNALTKKQKNVLDNTEYSCESDYTDHIEMMYDFNQLSRDEKKAMLNIQLNKVI
jgi:hypothetical protein